MTQPQPQPSGELPLIDSRHSCSVAKPTPSSSATACGMTSSCVGGARTQPTTARTWNYQLNSFFVDLQSDSSLVMCDLASHVAKQRSGDGAAGPLLRLKRSHRVARREDERNCAGRGSPTLGRRALGVVATPRWLPVRFRAQKAVIVPGGWGSETARSRARWFCACVYRGGREWLRLRFGCPGVALAVS